jgi:redox-sensitive bicupin YhaK (pirin superfamily)
VHQDAHVFVSRLNPGAEVAHPLGEGRGAYLYVIEGEAEVNGERMTTGDAAQVTEESEVRIAAAAVTEVVLVDVALG